MNSQDVFLGIYLGSLGLCAVDFTLCLLRDLNRDWKDRTIRDGDLTVGGILFALFIIMCPVVNTISAVFVVGRDWAVFGFHRLVRVMQTPVIRKRKNG